MSRRSSSFHAIGSIPVCTLVAAFAALAFGCGGGDSPAKTADDGSDGATSASPSTTSSPEASASAQPDEPPIAGVVMTCEDKGNVCLPPAKFVKKLCGNVNPDVALAYFRKGTPFTRGYLTGNTKAWNASGGAASSDDMLIFDEEVIVLSKRENNTGIEVSGASGGYDVLRWDGSCASLAGAELTLKPPPKAKMAKLEWKQYGEQSQNALLADATIAKINKERRDECKGVTTGDVSSKCVKAVDKLSDAIASFVRNGGEIPVPANVK